MTEETSTLLRDGLTVMVIGMGFVFLFLTITVYCINLTSFVLQKINKFFPEAVSKESKNTRQRNNNEEAIAVAIAAAKRFS